MESFTPHPALQSFIERYWAWEIPAAGGELDPILPDAAPELIFHLGTPPKVLRSSGNWEQQPDAFLLCASQRAVRLLVEAPMVVFAVRFRPWGASRFTDTSMATLLDREIPPEDVFSSISAYVTQQVRNATDTAERVSIVESALRSALADNLTKDERIRDLHRHASGGTAKGKDIAAALGISERTFRRLWQEAVGLEQRKFVALMRFHRALEMIDTGKNLSFVASECGYSDQPHLARDFKNISGLPASMLRKRLGNDVYRDLYSNRPAAPWTGN